MKVETSSYSDATTMVTSLLKSAAKPRIQFALLLSAIFLFCIQFHAIAENFVIAKNVYLRQVVHNDAGSNSSRTLVAYSAFYRGLPLKPEQKSVYFIKTHKCASTTLQRIILVHGLENNLTFAVPANGLHQFWPDTFRQHRAARSVGYPNFDVMAVHARHNSSSMAALSGEPIYLSIVRDPADQLHSTYEYYRMGRCLGNLSFENFMANVLYNGSYNVYSPSQNCPYVFRSNMQLFDLGIEVSRTTLRTSVAESIRLLDTEFTLVLVAELFDESIILMNDLLNWPLSDMVYFKSNARMDASSISDAARQAAYQWNWADKMLYDHFREKLERLVRSKEKYVTDTVNELKQLQETWFRYCVDEVVSSNLSNYSLGQEVRLEMLTYKLSEKGQLKRSCVLRTMSELSIIALIRERWPVVQGAIRTTPRLRHGR